MEEFRKKWVDFEPDIVPEQNEGRALEAESTRLYQDSDAAKMAYLKARERLLHVNNWASLVEGVTGEFRLTESSGQMTEETARKGLMIRIDIPGPGTKAGDGYDWVIIEEMEEGSSQELDFLAFRVKPSKKPLGSLFSNHGEEGIAHFYDPEASGTFVLYRTTNVVTCTIYDRNLKANTGAVSRVTDKLRNAVVGTTAAMGISGVQWQKLADAVVEDEQIQPAD